MLTLEEMLDKINLPIIIWKFDKRGELICDFVNDKVENVKIKDFFKKHHNLNISSNKLNGFSYNLNREIVCFSNMLNNTYVEIRYPHVNNIYLLSTISKKLREPLTNIITILSVLDQLTSQKFQQLYVPILQKSCYSIVYLANDIVDLIGIDNKTIRLTVQPFLLQDMVSKLIEPFKEECKQKGVKLFSKIEINYPYPINSDQARLQQVLVIFLKNAICHTSEGSVQLMVSLSNYNQIVFKIKDTGRGMNYGQRQTVDYILNFCQSSSQLQYEGFGLFIAKHLSQLLGATISYQSEVDIGSVFYLKLIDS